jgi:hypothetical protein
MKTNTTEKCDQTHPAGHALRNTCAACYQKALAQITAAKAVILAESKQMLAVPERLLRLALNEAEALAWQTTYPHLVFPMLAAEKTQAVAAWNSTQQAVRRSSPVLVRAR